MLFKDITSKLPQVYNVATRNKKKLGQKNRPQTIDAHGRALWLHRLVKLVDFHEKQAVFHQCSLLVMHKDDILRQFTLVALETQSSFTLVQFYHTIGYEPNVSSKKDRRWY